MSRYVYLLGSLPTSVIEKAHAQAFKDLPREKRRELFEELRPFLADGEQAIFWPDSFGGPWSAEQVAPSTPMSRPRAAEGARRSILETASTRAR